MIQTPHAGRCVCNQRSPQSAWSAVGLVSSGPGFGCPQLPPGPAALPLTAAGRPGQRSRNGGHLRTRVWEACQTPCQWAPGPVPQGNGSACGAGDPVS